MRRRTTGGFSLIEVVVALFLAGLILTLGVRLLREVQVVFLDWQRVAPEPVAQLGVALIRADVQSAQGTVAGSPIWSTGPLILAGSNGRYVHYDSELGELVRTVSGGDEGQAGERLLLRRVVSWQWRQLPGGVVEVILVHGRPRDPGSRLAGSRAEPRNIETRTETLFLRYAMRAVAGRTRW